MVSHEDVAIWLYKKILNEEVVFQAEASQEIEEIFGESFMDYNDN